MLASPEDNSEGPILEYRDLTTSPSAANPTIIIQGQRLYPKLAPSYDPSDNWIFVRRDETVFQLEISSADYSVPGYTYIVLAQVPPNSFRETAKTWEVLREIGGTIILSGDRVYNEATNPNGIQAEKFLRVYQKSNTPIKKRIPINGKSSYGAVPDYFIFDNLGNDLDMKRRGEMGKTYQIRDKESTNGNLVWNSSTSSSSWIIEPSSPNDPAISDHLGKIYVRQSACSPADLVKEITPGFTKIHLLSYAGSILSYSQDFRVKHVYLNNSSVGNVYNIWSEAGVYVIEVAGINGGPINQLSSHLSNLFAEGNDIYIEYEYNSFPVRTYYGGNTGGNLEFYPDFNQYPANYSFLGSTAGSFGLTAIANHTNWYFDQGILSGDYSMEAIRVGNWRGGSGTILTVSDDDNDILRTSSSFTVSQRNFDEDFAEKKLGTRVILWENYQDVVWGESRGLTWNILDFPTPYWCNFVIGGLGSIPATGKGFAFNYDSTNEIFSYVGSTSLPAPTGTTAQRWASGAYQLNNGATGGPSRFSYAFSPDSDVSLINLTLDTYVSGTTFTSNSVIAVGDVLYVS